MTHIFRLLSVLALGMVLASCGGLPGGGPSSRQVMREAQSGTGDFAIYFVTRAFLPTVRKWPATGDAERLPWIGRSQGARTQIIQPGDTLSLRIWDSSENSLLIAGGARNVPLEQVRVASNGTVFLPYLGDVSVVGLTPDLARRQLQEDLEAIVPSAQVELAMTEGRQNSVELIGGVRNPGTYPMPDRNYTVRSLLSAGGGVDTGLNNPQIRLVRGNAIFGTSVGDLLDRPGHDTLLRGGDQVFVEEDIRYFLSFGATGTQARYPFSRDRMSAMDAVSIMGGVNDSKADAKGLLILREYPASAVAPGMRGPRNTRVVFSINLTSLDGLFSARNFDIQPNDVVLATEAPMKSVLTISNIVGNLLGVFNNAGLI